MVHLLIEYGADVNAVDGDGNRALHWAAAKGIVCATEKLLSNHADPNLKNNEGDTALHSA
ncbi:hypothetical protein CAPTEDRAFT_102425, partial [Capitella teleta]